MSDDIEALCGKVSLIGGEREGISITEGEVAVGRERGERCLVGRIGEERKINKEAFKTVFTQLWRIMGSVVFKEVQENTWIFEFSDKEDKERIMEGRPWSFDRHILILVEFDGNVPPSQMQFSHSPFWVQVHDLPLVCMNKMVGTKIGESLGVVEDIDVAGDGMGWGHCLRIRVIIDVRQPLERGRALHLHGKTHWVTFKYEKLPMFCFTCGRILHGEKGCMDRKQPRHHTEEGAKQWGVYLRAETGRRKVGGEFGGGETHGAGDSSRSPAPGWRHNKSQHSGDRPSMGGGGLLGSHTLGNQPRKQNSCQGCSGYVSENEGESTTRISNDVGHGAKKVDVGGESFAELLNHTGVGYVEGTTKEAQVVRGQSFQQDLQVTHSVGLVLAGEESQGNGLVDILHEPTKQNEKEQGNLQIVKAATGTMEVEEHEEIMKHHDCEEGQAKEMDACMQTLADNLLREASQGTKGKGRMKAGEVPVKTWKRRARGARGREVEGTTQVKPMRQNTKRKIMTVEVNGLEIDNVKKARREAQGVGITSRILAEAATQPRQAP